MSDFLKGVNKGLKFKAIVGIAYFFIGMLFICVILDGLKWAEIKESILFYLLGMANAIILTLFQKDNEDNKKSSIANES